MTEIEKALFEQIEALEKRIALLEAKSGWQEISTVKLERSVRSLQPRPPAPLR